MKQLYKTFTSESVSEGHPDKICDQISDAILDKILIKDPDARVACEVMVKSGLIVIAGEVRTDVWVDVEKIARKTIIEIGYDKSELGFDGKTCAVINVIGQQSADIAQGVDESKGHEQGAGDQGLMFGYACNETEELMPAPISFAHKIVKQQAKIRKSKYSNLLYPDAKSQITLNYDQNGKPINIDTILLSTQHVEGINQTELKQLVIEEIIKPVIPEELIIADTKFLVNPTGNFVIGGPVGDCGLTGRKIIVDTYGGMAHHGGGAFSGKDPSKVDRSGAYVCRYVAKNIVKAKLAEVCEIQISYAIGIAEPTSIFINTFNTAKVDEDKLNQAVKEIFNLKPKGIVDSLNLKQPIYQETAKYGHFGRDDLNIPWEKTDKVDDLIAYFKF